MAVENTELTHPGTAASEDRDGKASWSDVDNIKAIADYATCDVVAATYSDWLRASNFGFQIPTGSTINGIEVRVRRKGELGVLRDSALYLVDANGDNDGDNKAGTGTFWPTSAANATYGSSSDTWGTDAVPFHINNSNFGIRLSTHNNDLSTRTASVAQVYIRVYYTPQATDWKTPAHCTTQTRTGSAVAWTNYSRAETSDNYYAEATVPTSSYTDWLRVDQFGFDSDDFPLTTVIAGFDIKIERKAGITSNLYDSAIHLRTSAGQHSANHAVATKWGTTDTEVVYRYLGPMGGDLSDTTKIQDDEFGIDLSVACDADAETIAYVDCISVRVHYAGEVSLLTETLQDYCNTDDNGQRSAYSVYWKAQSFTPSESYKVTSVKLRLFHEGSPGTIDVGIYATDGSGHPTGSALCSGTTDGDTLPTGSPYEWRQITLGAGYQLTSGIKYAIVVSAPSGSFFNWVRWRFVDPSGYANGNLL